MVTELNPLVPADVPAGLTQVPMDRIVDQLTVDATTIAEVRGVGVVAFQFHSSDPDAPWPLPIMFAGRPEHLRTMGRIVQQAAFRAANPASSRELQRATDHVQGHRHALTA